MRRICFSRSDLVANVKSLRFKERHYPEDMVNKETNKAPETPLLGRLKTIERSVPGNGGTWIPLVINNNPFLSLLGQVIQKNLCFLYQDEEVEKVFIPVPFVNFLWC